MSDWIWLNGEIIPMSDARIGVEDRGFQFADGVYEVIRLYNARPFTLDAHLERLQKSATGIDLPAPLDRPTLKNEIGRLIAKSAVRDGMIYLQFTRGVAPRNHLYPSTPKPTLLFYARPLPPANGPGEGEGAKLIAVDDDRWRRCWIKSIALLPNVLAKNKAIAAEADEAVFIDGGVVTECSASNLFAVIGGKLVTHPVGSKVLPGITRAVLLDAAATLDIEVDERGFSEEEAVRASELFITSTTREITWVARWNDRYIGQARCGPVTLALHRELCRRIRLETAG
ncbi:MAG TPA: D-amino acid aminotransferase [Tepidisphaeraceae bacterium]|jgi:D-alanine transaminase|nr:D-amino acid aminotransferase [Tepidisphaeraceae bacterium]